MSWSAMAFAAYLVIGGVLTTRTVVCGSRLTFVGWIVSVVAWPVLVAVAPEAYRRDGSAPAPLTFGPPRACWVARYPATDAGLARLLRDGAGLSIRAETLEALRPGLAPGDWLWTYETEPEPLILIFGTAGIVVVRDGQVVRCVVTS